MIAQTFRASHASLLLICTFSVHAIAGLPHAPPQSVAMNANALNAIDGLAAEGLKENLMPGCVVMVGRRGKIVFHRAYGHRQLQPTKKEMLPDTVFDMASITKPVATATSIMILVDQGKIRLRDRVSTYIPSFANSGKAGITVTQLLTHQAGFIPDNSIKDYEKGRKQAFENIYKLKTTYEPGTRFVYSDVGFVLLDDLIERQSGVNVNEFSQTNIFTPLGMKETGYLPTDKLRARAATTESRDSEWMIGEVHDPRSYLMGGVAGHAGLFSTAEDLAVYAQMMLNGGHYDGKRIVSKATVRLMTNEYRIVEGSKVSIRGLGWDKLTGYSSNRGENMSSAAFGHGGFTGTVLWIDPKHELFFIFLSNRVHPNGKGSVNRLAGRMATVAISAIDEEIPYEEANDQSKAVKTGIDRLIDSNFQSLTNQRIGLITNQTGISRSGTSNVKLLHENPNTNLVALFSPEHGLKGKLDQSIVSDSVDDQSGVKVFSLYGKSRSPLPEQLAQIDTLVFDIQDIGCRFYTYISTMGLAMQAAAKAGKRFVVLDRPNPINGETVSGPIRDDEVSSFVAFHDLPIQHGMTVGELARMFRHELGLDTLDLEVVPCTGWKRSQYFDETGLTWVNPSPNMRNLNQAILYPGVGVWETTNISVGRGTDTPFEILGAPWISAPRFARALNRAGLSGIRFTPRTFQPTASKYQGEVCGGVQISITDRSSFDALKLGMTIGTVLRRQYQADWKIDDASRLMCSEHVLNMIKGGHTVTEIFGSLDSDLEAFKQRRNRYLLY